MLCFELLDILVETRLVRDMATGELEYPLPAQCMLQWLFTDSTLVPHKSPLTPRSGPVGVQHAYHFEFSLAGEGHSNKIGRESDEGKRGIHVANRTGQVCE